MTITTQDGLFSALANNKTDTPIDKSSLASTAAGQYFSLWRTTGNPGQGAIPAAAAVCDNALLGGIPFTNPTNPVYQYLGWAQLVFTNVSTTVEIRDRLAHQGGLSGVVTTAQAANVDVSGGGSNLPARIGASDYSDVSWSLDWYADTGATSVNVSIDVTYNDNSTGTVTLTAIGATVRSGRSIPFTSAVAGKFIKSVQNVTLSATTGTAGSFGVTASRILTSISGPIANYNPPTTGASSGRPELKIRPVCTS